MTNAAKEYLQRVMEERACAVYGADTCPAVALVAIRERVNANACNLSETSRALEIALEDLQDAQSETS